MGHGAGGVGDGVGQIAAADRLAVLQALAVVDVPLGALGDGGHGADRFDGVFSGGRLA